MQSDSTVTEQGIGNLELNVFNPDNSSDDDAVPIQRNTPRTTAQLLPQSLPVPDVTQGSPLQELQSPYIVGPAQRQRSHPIHVTSASTPPISIYTSISSQPGFQPPNGAQQGGAQSSPYANASPLDDVGSSSSSRSSPVIDTTPPPTTPSNNLPPVTFGVTDDRNLDGLGLDVAAEADYPPSSSINQSQPDARSGIYGENSQNPSQPPPPAKVDRRAPVDKLIITVTADAENHVIVDITGAKDAASIRERMFSKLRIPDDHGENYQIYRTELGEAALGDPVTDDQLMIYCEAWADAKGTLKFLVQPAIPNTTPPLFFPSYDRRRADNAAGGLSSANRDWDRPPWGLSLGDDGDVELQTPLSVFESSALVNYLRDLQPLFIDVGRLKEETGYEEKRGGFGYARRLARELKVWRGLQHPHVLPLLGYYMDEEYTEAILISEYRVHGNLGDYIDQEKPPWDIRLLLTRDIIDGLGYLHGQSPPIRHGNLKLGNVIINAERKAMLADFNLFNALGTGSTGLTTSNGLRGTLRYFSPELMDYDEGSSLNLPSDIWAWACLALEVLTGTIAYADKKSEGGLIFAIVKGQPPCEAENISIPIASIKRLLSNCWMLEPDRRPSVIECLQVLNSEASALQDKLENCLRDLQHLFIDVGRLREETGYEEKRGGFGYVRVCTLDSESPQSKFVAAKTIYLKAQCNEPKRLALRLARELKVWAVLQHPHILALLGYYLDKEYTKAILISEYQVHGDLKEYIDREKPTLNVRLQLIRDSTDGLAYLHGRSPPIWHGDLKAGNVLINAQRKAVLADFGVSKPMEVGPTGLTTSKVLKGTLRYSSPELLDDDEEGASCDLPSDIWALGCLALEILTGRIPYAEKKTERTILVAILKGQPPCKAEQLSIPIPSISLLLAKCWTPEPNERPSAISCLDTLNLEASAARGNEAHPSSLAPSRPNAGDVDNGDFNRA
ncbi:hypothetical protein FRC01_003917 [Tulasnella sp. 417]|nr:hypothetical protein FRC01_003917 [Tulasnella sp. 417]